MKQKSLVIAAALAGVVLTANVSAFSPKDSVAAPTPRPVLASVVQPTGLPPSFAGKIVNIEFSLDQAGQPHDIRVLRVEDAVLTRQLVAAFREWRFEPGVTAAPASTKRFILPLQLQPEV